MSTAEASRTPSLWRRALAEFLGTAVLVAIGVGTGIAVERLSSDAGLQLLESSIATTLGLSVLIVVLAPVSGAHLNPAVSLVDAIFGRRNRTGLSASALAAYLGAQLAGAVAGAVLANAMFGVPTTIAGTQRATGPVLLGEVVATAGLLFVIVCLVRAGRGPMVIGPAVGAYIGAAYWFTSSTSFANPAVTIGRLFSDTYTGIAPESALAFLGAQVVGALLGAALAAVLFARQPDVSTAVEPAEAPADLDHEPSRRSFSS